MRCDYFRCTMKSSLCLEYQARARGEGKRPDGSTPNEAIIGHWAIKYKPCLNCQQGQQIAKNGGDDTDVEHLAKQAQAGTKYCRYCDTTKPVSEFYEASKGSGKYTPECKQCTKNRLKRTHQARKAQQEGTVQPEAKPEKITLAGQDVSKLVAPLLAKQTAEPTDHPTPPTEAADEKWRRCQICKSEPPIDNFRRPDGTISPNICNSCLDIEQINTDPADVPPDHHPDVQPISTKRCSRCRSDKTLDQFHRNRMTPDGLDRRCRQCKNELKMQAREKNRLKQPSDMVVSISLPGSLYDKIYQEASRELRSVENHCVWLLREWATGGFDHAD